MNCSIEVCSSNEVYLCLAQAVVFLGQVNVSQDDLGCDFGFRDILHQIDAQNFVSAVLVVFLVMEKNDFCGGFFGMFGGFQFQC